MRIATWNVNSIRARLDAVLLWLQAQEPDVLCMQETKCTDDVFPYEAFEQAGYHAAHHGEKTYNGVAILAREPLEDIVLGLPDDDDDAQKRVVAATVNGVRLLNLYVVNGQSVGSEKYAYKLEWLDRVLDYLATEFDPEGPVVVTGDFNITRDDRDVYDPEAWREKILCSTEERQYLEALIEMGYTDAVRESYPQGGVYTWFDFRTRGFERGRGLRIDHFFLSPPATRRFEVAEVDLEERGKEKPSDHAPVVITLRS